MKGKKYMKMFPFCTRNPWSIRPTACLLQLSYHVHLFIAIHITWIPYLNVKKEKFALAGNRTTVSRVAGENSTTEPPMLASYKNFPCTITYQKESRTFFSAKIVSGYKSSISAKFACIKVSGSAINMCLFCQIP